MAVLLAVASLAAAHVLAVLVWLCLVITGRAGSQTAWATPPSEPQRRTRAPASTTRTDTVASQRSQSRGGEDLSHTGSGATHPALRRRVRTYRETKAAEAKMAEDAAASRRRQRNTQSVNDDREAPDSKDD